MTGGSAAVMTVDVITPLVDDPETFGAIAACNSLSDVYAMGGAPRFALNLVFFPDDQLPLSVLQDILRGGQRVCESAGVAIVGGHSVRDAELKFGLSVTGEVDEGAMLSNDRARAGQALVLSKPLGTGVITTAFKRGLARPGELDAAVASMTTLNRQALAHGREHGVTACTDVTGFGLLGHLRNILVSSGLRAVIELAALPLLPGALAHAEADRVPGGSRKNLEFIESQGALRRRGDERRALTLLAADAQTSGGLLLCVDASRAPALVADLRASGHEAAWIGALAPPDAQTPTGTITLDF